eukprot:1006139_1
MYRAIQLQVDISGDWCAIYWRVDGGFPHPDSYTTIGIDLTVKGDAITDRCFFDNAILRGILAPTNQPTSLTANPTNKPSNIPTLFPTQNPSITQIRNQSVS